MKAAILTLFLIFMTASPCLCNDLGQVFNVISYGAVGNGKTDDTNVWFFISSLFNQSTTFITFFCLFLFCVNLIFFIVPLSLDGTIFLYSYQSSIYLRAKFGYKFSFSLWLQLHKLLSKKKKISFKTEFSIQNMFKEFFFSINKN